MASAVGDFPSALRGYDRTAVDDYVRTLEASVVQSSRHAAQLELQVSSLQDQLSALQNGKGGGSGAKPDFSNLGGRTNDILRLAQDQAREIVATATVEAEKLKEAARRGRPTAYAAVRLVRVMRSRPAERSRSINCGTSCRAKRRLRSRSPRPRPKR